MGSIFPRVDVPIAARGAFGPGGQSAQAQGEGETAVPDDLSGQHPNVRLFFESSPGSGSFSPGPAVFFWRDITLNQDGQDTTATIEMPMLLISSLGAPYGGGIFQDLAFYNDFISPDRALRIIAQFGISSYILFEGYPILSTVAWQPGQHSIRVQAVSTADEIMRHDNYHVLGQFVRTRQWLDWDSLADPSHYANVDALPTIFNPDGRPNRTADSLPFEFGGETYELHLFADVDANEGIETSYWTYAHALRYLIFHHMIRGNCPISGVEFMADSDSISGEANIGINDDPLLYRLNRRVIDQSVESLSMDEAIAALVLRAGLHYHYRINPADGTYILRVYATVGDAAEDAASDPSGTSVMGRPVVRDIEREEPFSIDLEGADPPTIPEVAERNRHQNVSIINDYRGINDTFRRGGVEEYQIGVILRPGWFPIFELDDPTDVADSEAFWLAKFDPEYEQEVSGGPSRIPTSLFHGLHPLHGQLRAGAANEATPINVNHDPVCADVFRRWVFPDSWRYMINFNSPIQDGTTERDPYARPVTSPMSVFDASYYEPLDEFTGINVLADVVKGGGLVEAENWTPRNRPFRNLIGRRNPSVTDRSPLVMLNWQSTNITDALNAFALQTDVWMEFGGAVSIDEKVAAIRFEDANIFNSIHFVAEPWLGTSGFNAIQAYLRGTFWVAVVATVQSDDRLFQNGIVPWASTRSRKRVLDYGLQRFIKRDKDSGAPHPLTNVIEVDPQYLGRDRTQAFEDQGTVDTRFTGVFTVAGDPESFYIDLEPQIGDSYSGAPGMGIVFSRYPTVQSIRFVNNSDTGGSFRTTLHLTDLRTAPEVNTE